MALKLSDALRIVPTEQSSHPARHNFRLLHGVAMIVMPARPPHHYVVEMDGPLISAVMLDYAAAKFRWKQGQAGGPTRAPAEGLP